MSCEMFSGLLERMDTARSATHLEQSQDIVILRIQCDLCKCLL